MQYLSFDFEITNSGESEQLVALLSDLGFEGFEETDTYLHAFIQQEKFSDTDFAGVIQLFETVAYTAATIENTNWNQQWEESFEPVVVNDFVAIRAHFHQPIKQVKYEIIITPKMSFGTGHHATTHLVIERMSSIDFEGKQVLDFGTGTGILAILAEKLGAAAVLAVDNDEWSINNATENIIQNSCTNVVIEQHNSIPVVKKYDIILANINLNVITANLDAIKLVASPGCQIIFSGFLKADEGTMKENVAARGLQYVSTHQDGNWITMEVIK
ncbi:MAG: ribosomal protein L11P-lysine N-methyltransferase [Ferruginibacter sp.]|uniref:50S ribosomal protein L11 methyltransferase n=1 Tax=Ferruginibacter sp. TaxID=1940288 RepID=UPI0026596209|nr:50S ribosomal protein L11 methyltransferase [Ferruginibacter sp.]MDB5277592.1 ribosomal protein L11P-lysine N-methyltransferase [Ferruginibacter sp.]